MWLKQIKIIAGSKRTHKYIPSGCSIFSFSHPAPRPQSLPPTSPSDSRWQTARMSLAPQSPSTILIPTDRVRALPHGRFEGDLRPS